MTTEPSTARTVHVLPHTHWDREWYDPYPAFRIRLVELLDELLPRLEDDPGFTHFQLDGQMAVVDDYLEVRPAERERLARLARDGRLSMGPWYVLPDEFLVSGETLVRDVQLGLRRAEAFGGAMPVGYLPDMFGHVAQMPQLLALFGMHDAVVWRGVPAAMQSPAFRWRAPDGTEVRAEYLPGGYFNGSNMPDDVDELVTRIDLFAAFQGPMVSDRILWMAGMDHEVPPAHLPRVVAELDQRWSSSGGGVHVGSLAEYLADAAAHDGELPVIEGELRSSARANLLMGVASNRVDVKVAAAAAERALERVAEPLDTLWQLDRRWAPLLEAAWLDVIRNAAHDSICACSHDEVVDAVLHRYAEATRTASEVAARAVGAASARMAEPGSHLLNPSSFDRRDVVELTLPLEEAPRRGVQVLEEHPATEVLHRTGSADAPLVVAREMLMEQTDTVAARLVEVDAVLQVHLLPARDDDALDLDDALGQLGQRCAAEPELVVETVLHRATPTQRLLVLSDTVPGFGWSPAAPVLPDEPVAAVGAHGLTNGLVRLEVDPADGSWSVDGLAGLGRLVDDGDVGDTYNWCPPDVDTVVDRPERVAVERTADGPVCGTLVIDAEYLLPEREGVDAEGRSIRAGEVRQQVRTTLELRADEPFVRVTVELDQRARDHRLRALFPLPRRTDHSLAECAYAHVRRPLHAEGGPGEWGVPTYPSRRHVRAGGLLVVHEGLCEYELVDLDGDAEADTTTAGALALTLVRSTGWLSRGPMTSRPLPAGPEDRLEGAQTLKPLVLRYVVAVDPDDALDAEQTCDRAFSPLVVLDAPGGGDLPPHGSWLRVHGAVVDALLPDERAEAPAGGLVVRVHESVGRAGELVVEDRTGTVVDLTGAEIAPFEGRLPLRPHQIVTLRLDPRIT
jgi:mannosylglycerate hydrolase